MPAICSFSRRLSNGGAVRRRFRYALGSHEKGWVQQSTAPFRRGEKAEAVHSQIRAWQPTRIVTSALRGEKKRDAPQGLRVPGYDRAASGREGWGTSCCHLVEYQYGGGPLLRPAGTSARRLARVGSSI